MSQQLFVPPALRHHEKKQKHMSRFEWKMIFSKTPMGWIKRINKRETKPSTRQTGKGINARREKLSQKRESG